MDWMNERVSSFSLPTTTTSLASKLNMNPVSILVCPVGMRFISGWNVRMVFSALSSQSYNPNRVLLYKNGQNLTKIAPWTDSQTMIDGKPTAYVCKNFACNLPTNELKLALEQLEK